MTIEQFAEQNGFVKLTNQNHPKDGQTVEILGRSISKDFNIEKVQWSFDGTNHAYKWITHEFPKVGKDINAVPVLKALVENGHQLVLFTMRSDIVNPTGEDNELHLESGSYLTDAVNWFKDNEIPLYGIQTNPTQHTWTTSPKAYAQMYIDDAALGCPLKYDKEFAERPFVDWSVVRDMLKWNGLLS